MSEACRIKELEERLEIVMEMRDAICRQVDEILIRRNNRIADLEAIISDYKRSGESADKVMYEQRQHIAELEEWIRNKRDSNFEFACKHIEGWTKDKDSFYAECTEILERK